MLGACPPQAHRANYRIGATNRISRTTPLQQPPRGTFFGKLDAQTFSRLLGAGEFTLGASLLLPIVPPAMAGLGLAGFSAELRRVPANAEDASERQRAPDCTGNPLAKDACLDEKVR